jgi:CRISPR-associated exonuclease Cas4
MDESDLIPLSALQHFLFCPRQCALIHVEQVWAENRFTAEGSILHAKTDQVASEIRRGVKTVTAVPIRSFRLGVSGIADVVELDKLDGRWQPFPVEYKRGKPKAHRADEVQLCAQGFALEEMFVAHITEGALFYGAERRRTRVTFDSELRALTIRIAVETRTMIASARVPTADYEKKRCDACSLIDICRPKSLGQRNSVAEWLAHQIEEP